MIKTKEAMRAAVEAAVVPDPSTSLIPIVTTLDDQIEHVLAELRERGFELVPKLPSREALSEAIETLTISARSWESSRSVALFEARDWLREVAEASE